MLPANRDDRSVSVHRVLDADEDAVVDAISAFAEEEHLDVDRRVEGPGLRFVADRHGKFFSRGDTLHVLITPDSGGHEVDMVADLRATASRKAEGRRGDVVRSGLFAALFGYLGVRGVIPPNGLDIIDIVWFGLSARFGLRARSFATAAAEDIDETARKLANELNRVCDEAEER